MHKNACAEMRINMQGYSTPSRKRILEYLEKNKNRTVTAADIENYLIEKECAVNNLQIFRQTDNRKKDSKICCRKRKKGYIPVY